jgi:hypothetical protein
MRLNRLPKHRTGAPLVNGAFAIINKTALIDNTAPQRSAAATAVV